jgi:circadian clock protein KaiC
VASQLEHVPSGIPGFDLISNGGFVRNRATLLAGSAGSGKTVCAVQFLVAGARNFGENGVMVTFEETPEDIAQNVANFGWDLQSLVDDGKVAMIDATPSLDEDVIEVGQFDFMGLLARIEAACERVGAKRIVLDSTSAVFAQFDDDRLVRRELHRLIQWLRKLGVTSLITVERDETAPGSLNHHVEDFVADNVVLMRNVLESEKRRRTIEILKFRGTSHRKGEYPFTILDSGGVDVIPLSAIESLAETSNIRVSWGDDDVDAMFGGGLFRDAMVLISGPTGTGKTLMVTQFIAQAAGEGKRALLFSFEESRGQLIRNATSWGIDLASCEEQGLVRIIARYPERMSLEDLLVQMRADIEEFGPERIAVDSLTALERSSTPKSFQEFVVALTGYVKQRQAAGVFTNTTTMLLGGQTATETHLSTTTDAILLLRYIEAQGTIKRGMLVLKMRGSNHEKDVREYWIDDDGIHVGAHMPDATNLLGGAREALGGTVSLETANE